MVIAIGCTGGRHRSVAIAEHLAKRYRGGDDLDVAVAHRDIDKAPTDTESGPRPKRGKTLNRDAGALIACAPKPEQHPHACSATHIS